MDTHADLHLVFANLKGGLADFRNDARAQSNTHASCGCHSLFSYPGHFLQGAHGLSLSTCKLISKEQAGYAPALLPVVPRRRSYVISDQHRLGLNVGHLQNFSSHIKVHHIAAVVAEQEQYTGT